MAEAIVSTQQKKFTAVKSLEKNTKRATIVFEDIEALEKGFTARALILATMPHSKPNTNEFVRKNGNYTLTMIAPSSVGLPYGSIPRLILAWITTEAVRTKSRTLKLGKNLADFLRVLGVDRTGGKRGGITYLREQLNRLLSTSIYCTYSDETTGNRAVMPIASKCDLWWAPKGAEQEGLEEYTITLGEDFFNEITKNPVVFCMGALGILRKSPLALDIYFWLTYKMSYTKGPVVIPWASLQNQFGAEYQKNAVGKAHFKAKFIEALKKVEAVYSEAGNLQVGDDGLLVLPGKPHVPKLPKREAKTTAA